MKIGLGNLFHDQKSTRREKLRYIKKAGGELHRESMSILGAFAPISDARDIRGPSRELVDSFGSIRNASPYSGYNNLASFGSPRPKRKQRPKYEFKRVRVR